MSKSVLFNWIYNFLTNSAAGPVLSCFTKADLRVNGCAQDFDFKPRTAASWFSGALISWSKPPTQDLGTRMQPDLEKWSQFPGGKQKSAAWRLEGPPGQGLVTRVNNPDAKSKVLWEKGRGNEQWKLQGPHQLDLPFHWIPCDISLEWLCGHL